MGRSTGDHGLRAPHRVTARLTAPQVVAALVAVLAAVLALVVVTRSPDPPPAAGPLLDAPLDGERWTPVLDEGFDAPDSEAFLAAGRWHAGWFGDGRLTQPVNGDETALYDRRQLQVRDGLGLFTVRPNTAGLVDDGRAEPHLAAVVNTDPAQAQRGFTVGYGYVEVRMQQPAGSAAEELWPAFWLNGDDWPSAMEIDVVEGDGTDEGCSFNVHHGPPGRDVTNLNAVDNSRTVPGATTGMHVYGADIRPDGVTFYHDGRPVYAWSGEVPDTRRYLVVGLSTGGTLDRDATLLVDWVRVWARSTRA